MSEGFAVRVSGHTELTGGVLASTAGEGRNSLTTGTLSASDIANRESYRASQISLSGGANIGGGKSSKVGGDKNGQAVTPPATPDKTLPATPAGGNVSVSAGLPVMLKASGDQASTTHSAIAAGSITVTSDDAASQQTAQTISRDTKAANSGALVQQFDAAKRAEIAQGFAAVQELATQTSQFLTIQAKKAEAWQEANPNAAPKDNPYATWGAGGTGRLVLTALNGAAGGDVSGSVGGLVQGAAVGVLQGLATQQVKKLADTLQSEEARAALQALVGCAGSAAAGGDCGAGAMGAAGSVVLNNLLKTGATPAVDAEGNPLSPSEQQARETLVATLVGAIAQAAGLDANSAVTAARIETGNNATAPSSQKTQKVGCQSSDSMLGTATDVLDAVALGADVLALGAAGVAVATAPTVAGGITAGGVAAGARLFSATTSLVSAGLKLYDGNYRGAAASGIGALVGGGAEAGTRILLKLVGANERAAGVAAEGFGLATSNSAESGSCRPR